MAKAGRAGNDLDAILDALYAAAPAEFVNARNALAKSLGKNDAARVKALKKPSAAAWAVNHLALSSPRLLGALVAAGDRLRAKPGDLREAMQKRRDALTEARKAAEEALTSAGHAATPDVMRRVSATFEAIATFGSAPGAPVAGRLSEDVAAPGFDEVASLGLLGGGGNAGGSARRPEAAPPRPALPPEKAHPRVEPPRAPSKRDAARARALEEKNRREAKAALAAKAKEALRARAALKAAENAVEAARRKRSSLESALAEAAAAEKKLAAELAEARKASEAADAAERA